jgi:hypothetical protein
MTYQSKITLSQIKSVVPDILDSVVSGENHIAVCDYNYCIVGLVAERIDTGLHDYLMASQGSAPAHLELDGEEYNSVTYLNSSSLGDLIASVTSVDEDGNEYERYEPVVSFEDPEAQEWLLVAQKHQDVRVEWGTAIHRADDAVALLQQS